MKNLDYNPEAVNWPSQNYFMLILWCLEAVLFEEPVKDGAAFCLLQFLILRKKWESDVIWLVIKPTVVDEMV